MKGVAVVESNVHPNYLRNPSSGNLYTLSNPSGFETTIKNLTSLTKGFNDYILPAMDIMLSISKGTRYNVTDSSANLCSQQGSKSEMPDPMAPRFSIRYFKKEYSFPLYFDIEPDSIETVILQSLNRMSKKSPMSENKANKWLLFANGCHVGTVEELKRLPRGAELVLVEADEILNLRICL